MIRRLPYLAFAIPLSVFLLSFFLSLLNLPDTVFTGITYDLIILSPAMYFLAIRKTRIPNITVVPVLFAGVLLGGIILPDDARTHYDMLGLYLLPLVELAVMGVVGYYAIQTIRTSRRSQDNKLDFFQVLEQSCASVIGYPKLAKILSLEFGGLYYALFKWKKNMARPNEFTYHSTSGLRAILYAVIGITVAETLILHILLAQWNATIAWVLSGLSIYGGLMILAHLKAMNSRPHVLQDTAAEVKNGLFGYARIPYDEIEDIEIGAVGADDIHKLAFLGALEDQNVLIRFRNQLPVEGPYGRIKNCGALLLHADQPDLFRQGLLTRMEMLRTKNHDS